MVNRISKNLQQRLMISAFSIVLLVTLISMSYKTPYQLSFTAVLSLIISCALWEYYQIAVTKGYKPLVKTGIATGIAYIFATYLGIHFPVVNLMLPFILAVAFLFGFLYFFFQEKNPLSNLAITTFGVAYLVIPLSYLLSINYFFFPNGTQDGRWWLLYLLTVTKMTDTGAFATGKNLGKTQLAAHISPKKTVEGAIGGMCVAIITSFVFPHIAHWISPESSFNLSLWPSIILGAVIGVLAQVGDLGESLLKRDAGVKDSNQLPGLGGILDIVDSLIFTTPVVYFFLQFQQKMTGAAS